MSYPRLHAALRPSRGVLSATATDPSFSSVKLLMGFEGANGSTTMPDEGPAVRGNATTNGGSATISTAQQKYGSSSLNLASSSYLTYPQSADFDPSGDFTAECFLRPTTSGGTLMGNWNGGSLGWLFVFTTTQLRLHLANTANTITETAPLSLSLSTWYHMAFDKSGTTYRLYLDGAMVGKGVFATPLGSSALGLFIGRTAHTSAGFITGQIDEIRITNGVARYNSDSGFAVPTSAFPRS